MQPFQLHSIHSRQGLAQTFNRNSASLGRLIKGRVTTNRDQVSEEPILLMSRPLTTVSKKRGESRQDMRSQLPQRAATSQKTFRSKPERFVIEPGLQRVQSAYQKVFYANTQFQNLLHLNKFRDSLVSLKPNDRKCPIVLSLLRKHFTEIEINDFNILICQHKTTDEFFVYFSDSDWIPFSQCCEVPIFVKINVKDERIKMMCNDCDKELTDTPDQNIAHFFGHTAYQKTVQKAQSMKYIGMSTNHEREQLKISKMVISGKFKLINMKKNYQHEEIKKLKAAQQKPILTSPELTIQGYAKPPMAPLKFTRTYNKYADIIQQSKPSDESTLFEIQNIIDKWID